MTAHSHTACSKANVIKQKEKKKKKIEKIAYQVLNLTKPIGFYADSWPQYLS